MISGALYVVATPIGNLEDFSPRAVRILKEVALILAEDTRHSAVLLNHFGIDTPVTGFHEHNEQKLVSRITGRLKAGESIALISDAGTPLINDPGYCLVAAAHAEHIRVSAVPGPSAVMSALSVSGLPTDRFVYEGFLPAKDAARKKRLVQLSNEDRTLVFYEVPHRICNSLADMISCFGPEREATLAKELTKYYETIYKNTLANLLSWLNEKKERQKGEFVLLVRGCNSQEIDESECIRVLEVLLNYLSVKDAAAVAATLLKDNRNRMYRLALNLGHKEK